MPASKHPPAQRNPNHADKKSSAPSQTGLVIVNYGKAQLIEGADGRLHRCVARRGLKPIVCGDRVSWQPTHHDEGVVESIDARRTVLSRADGKRRARPLAANIDQMLIVAAPEPPLDEFLIDKYCITAELAGTSPLLVINKFDLLDAAARDELQNRMADYTATGYKVLLISALENTGIETISNMLAGKTSILLGQSGVGKSSLIKRLLPAQEITIGKLSEASGLGRHTTTASTLYHLPHGGDLIDSPGVRDFRLGKTDAADLAHGFREFRPRIGQCRFHNCRHLTEPGCAIDAAARQGGISPRRLESYRLLLTNQDSAD